MTRFTEPRSAAFPLILLAAACGDAVGPPAGFQPPPVALEVDLGPGEFITLAGADALSPIDLPAADDTRQYVLVIQNASSSPGDETTVQLEIGRVGTFASTSRASRLAGLAAAARPFEAAPFDAWYGEGEGAFRTSVRAEVARRRVAPAVGPGRSARASRVSARPQVGEPLQLRSPVDIDGTLSACTSAETVDARVRAVGARFAIVEEEAVAGPLSTADYDGFLAEMESVVAPVSEAYFGSPLDIDGNGVVIVLVSSAVNRLGAAGFFTPSDLTPAADCPSSNEGEVLWLTAPDATGQFGEAVTADLIRSRFTGIVAHELQHLVHAERRAFEAGAGFDAGDELWLNEGLSHIAEEVTGLYGRGLRAGANHDYADIASLEGRSTFLAYHLTNFRFMRDYFASPGTVPAIIDGPVTRGSLRQTRGFGYLFLRWLADQFASDGAAGLVSSVREEELFRALAVGVDGLQRSTRNVEMALASVLGVSRTWNALFAEYAAVPAVDDATLPQVPLASSLELSTWNLPRAFENARDGGFTLDFPNGFPLVPRLLILPQLPDAGFSGQIDLQPSTAEYFRLESPRSTPLTRIQLAMAGGGSAGNGALQITIVRTF